MNSTALFVGTALLLALTGAVSAQERKVPEATVMTGEGIPLNLLDRAKAAEGPILLVLWATWASPSVALLQKLHEANQELEKDQKIPVIAISVDVRRNRGKVHGLFRSHGWTFESFLDPNETFKKALGDKALPLVLVVTPSGVIEAERVGYAPGDEAEILAAVRALRSPGSGRVEDAGSSPSRPRPRPHP